MIRKVQEKAICRRKLVTLTKCAMGGLPQSAFFPFISSFIKLLEEVIE